MGRIVRKVNNDTFFTIIPKPELSDKEKEDKAKKYELMKKWKRKKGLYGYYVLKKKE